MGGTREEAETETVSGQILEFLQSVVELKTEPEITEAVEGKTKFASPAQAINHTVTPYTHPVVVPDEEDDSVFNYLDTAATKAGIVAANRELEGSKIAIVGAGGTGGYVLDFVAKTPVSEIHLFDRDVFLNHNAFRCPGAPSLDDLSKKQMKVNYLVGIYSRMRKRVIPHICFIEELTIEQLREISFVFICIDKGTGNFSLLPSNTRALVILISSFDLFMQSSRPFELRSCRFCYVLRSVPARLQCVRRVYHSACEKSAGLTGLWERKDEACQSLTP